MKKLMLTAAAAVLSMGAFALCGDAEPVVVVVQKTVKVQRQVYKTTFCGKTTTALPGKSVASACGDVTEGCYARVPAKLKIKGWIALCDTACTALVGGTADAESYAFWATKPFKADLTPDADLTFDFINVIGKKPNKAEAAGKFTSKFVFAEGTEWDLADGLAFAGLGSYKKPIYKKITGNFVGQPAASWYISNAVCAQSDVYDCDTLQLLCGEYPSTVAFGKWTLKYSKSAAKKLGKGQLPKVPSYATYKNAAE